MDSWLKCAKPQRGVVKAARQLKGKTMAIRAHAAALSVLATLALPAGSEANTLVPTPDHVVIVVEENHGYSQIIGSGSAPYIDHLAAKGALFTDSHAISHPSQPNYLDLFSGGNQGITDDSCPHSFSAESEASELIATGATFVGYSEDLPGKGSLVCTAGKYARKHAPWTNFTNLSARSNLPFTKFPSDYNRLPTVAWVIPNLDDDMHDGTIAAGDSWLKNNLAAYADWAMTNNSLLIVTFDEDDSHHGDQVATIFLGPMVKAGQYGEYIDHYTVLRTISAMYGLKPLGNAADKKPIRDVWK
jgi:acid phosphatase